MRHLSEAALVGLRLPMLLLLCSAAGLPGRAPATEDGTQGWMTAPNFPLSDRLPRERVPALPDGLKLEPGSMSLAALSFLPGGTTDTRAKLDAQMYYNPITGNQQTSIASSPGDPIDYSAQPTWSRLRHYPPGSRWDLFSFDRNGLHLNAICSRNNTAAGCTPGHIYSAFIRLPDQILPGDVIYARLKFPSSRFAWASWWEYEGTQFTPGPGGNPYGSLGVNVPGALIQYEPGETHCYYEVDNLDQYLDPGVSPGRELNAHIVAKDDACHKIAPHDVYRADGPEFEDHPNKGFPFSAFSPASGMLTDNAYHDYVVNFRKIGHLVDFIVDGKLFATQYWEYNPHVYLDAAGKPHPVALHMILSTQPGPSFIPEVLHHVVPQDGGPVSDGPWSLSLQTIKHIRGNVLNVDALATDRNGVPP
jgi:hypothetical protein